METAPQSFAKRLDRFVRWFLTASPTEAVELPLPSKPQAARRAESRRPPARVRARHSGPVRVSVEGKS